jgi:hypothetical protein
VNEFTIIILKFTMATQKMDIPGVTDKFEYVLAAIREKKLSDMDPLATMEKLEKVNAKVSKMRGFYEFFGCHKCPFFATCHNSGSRPKKEQMAQSLVQRSLEETLGKIQSGEFNDSDKWTYGDGDQSQLKEGRGPKVIQSLWG